MHPWSLCERQVGEPGSLLNCCFKWVNCLYVKFTAIKIKIPSVTLKMSHCPTQDWSSCGDHVLRWCPLRGCSESQRRVRDQKYRTPHQAFAQYHLWDLCIRRHKATYGDGPRLTCGGPLDSRTWVQFLGNSHKFNDLDTQLKRGPPWASLFLRCWNNILLS